MTDKATFARKLMRINERVVATNTPSAIFGSIGDLPQAVNSRAPLRIGMFPCISEEDPIMAMGIWAIMAHLLDHWRDIEVYRLFVQFDEEPEDFVWTINKSQFGIEDWTIPQLDENIGMWGTLKSTDAGWNLDVVLDNDNLTGDDTEPMTVSLSTTTESELFIKLPDFARQIADTIEAVKPIESDPIYNVEDFTFNNDFRDFLEQALEWEASLLGTLWGVELDDDDIRDNFEALLDAGKVLGDDITAWTTAKAVAETMRPGYSVIGDLLIDRATEVSEAFNSNYAMPILAGAIFNMGFAPKSYRLLDNELKVRPKNTIGWLKSGDIHAEGGLLLDAIDKFQSAIEEDAFSNELYRAYGNTLLLAEREGQELEAFILIDLKNEYGGNFIAWEAIEAYKEALKLNESDLLATYAKILQLVEVDYEQEFVWDDFAKLVKLDDKGDHVSDVIEALYNIEDISPGIAALTTLMDEAPNRLDVYINLAALYIVGYESDSAIPILEKATSLATSATDLADIERMMLSASDPEFEYRFGEIMSILDAGNTLQANDVEFLENVVENAPHAIEGHIALGRSYYLWKEYDEALEVLLDAQEAFPDQPVVLDWLARILWESGERETAFTYLNRGIAEHPFNVQLIARAGQYLFDNDQLEEARQYLQRAEAISPRHPMLKYVRTYIARRMSEDPQKYNEG